VLNGDRPVRRIGSLTRRSLCRESAGLFLAANGSRAVLSLTKFRQINQHDPQRLTFGGIAQSGLFEIPNTLELRSASADAQGEMLMKKTLAAFAAAATVATAIAAMPTSADARCYGCAVGAGVLGGFVAGAIVGNAIANAQPAPVYVAPAPVYAAPRTCLVEEQVWSNRYQAWVTRPVRVAC
jgi:hypothetical protein